MERGTRSDPGPVERAATRGLGALLRFDERLVDRFDPPVGAPLSPHRFDWATPLERGWADIRAELDALLAEGIQLPTTDDLVGSEQGAEGKWSTYVMCWYGTWIERTCARMPRTTRLLRQVPDIQIGGFTVLGPRTHIPEHQGPAKSFRYHLGVTIPGPPGACRLSVGDEIVSWAEGRSLAFDDRTPHEAWNETDEDRYVLFVQVPWPLGGAPGLAHRGVHRVFAGATRRIATRAEHLDEQLNPA